MSDDFAVGVFDFVARLGGEVFGFGGGEGGFGKVELWVVGNFPDEDGCRWSWSWSADYFDEG